MNYKGYLLIDKFREVASHQGNKAAFLYEKQSWTFKHLDEFSNAVGNALMREGFGPGDTIAFFMETRPAYVGVWLGMSKVGIVPALINSNLRGSSLVHCIKDANCKGLIFGVELSSAVKDVLPQLAELQDSVKSSVNNGNLEYSIHMSKNSQSTTFPLYSGDFGCPEVPHVPIPKCKELSYLITDSSPPPYYVDHSVRGKVGIRNKLFYIYTSGTTGLPKAAIVNQGRFITMSYAVSLLLHIRTDDVIYNTLPLYHTVGGIIGVGMALTRGSTVVLRRKFSASCFWEDCIQYKCTVVQYIGEICRYLLAQPYRPQEKQHQVRLAFGNGLRQQIWTDFQQRFGVAQVGEFYGATESNTNIVNIENKVGAVGFTTRIFPFLHPVALIRTDEQTGEPLRDSRGLCIRCEVGEMGELVGRIDNNPLRYFDGYTNNQATNKKILANVFRMGDIAFRTGDLLVMDDLGYFYFRDRLGETYRWRGENVSTTEVEALLGQCLKGQHDCVVYGVEVPNCEGKAGMACIADANNTLNLETLVKDIGNTLPSYARPLFLRLPKTIETTGTFKLKKTELQKQGFNPKSAPEDRFYFLDSAAMKYVPLDDSVYDAIVKGQARL